MAVNINRAILDYDHILILGPTFPHEVVGFSDGAKYFSLAFLMIVMGVSGYGKTTIGQALANHFDCPFYDADDFHPAENVAKMASGVPLDDTDRVPWLATLAALMADHGAKGETAVLACSALKKNYRDQLRGDQHVQFVYLKGSFDLIWQRMQSRQDHYMKAEMLQSQFEVLEPPDPDKATEISIDQPIEKITAQILETIN